MKASRASKILRKYRVEAVGVALGFALMNVIFLSEAFRGGSRIDPTGAGQLGDFIGGYVGTLFSLVNVVLLITTLRSQTRANQKQAFEAKYFELLKMHRDNVAELNINDASGTKTFVLLVRELRCILTIVRKLAEEHHQSLSQEEKLCIAYNCLFFGTGPNSSRMLRGSLTEFDDAFVDCVEKTLNDKTRKESIKKSRNFSYMPFEGHQSRLGHYYRHLYQTVRYVDCQTIDIDKTEFTRTIRAQLSTHEQALLLVNSRTIMGRDWWRKKLIVEYRVVQNIPKDFFDASTELDTSTLFSPGYFEWEDMESLFEESIPDGVESQKK